MAQYNINKYGDKIVPCVVCGKDTQDLKETEITVCIACAKTEIGCGKKKPKPPKK